MLKQPNYLKWLLFTAMALTTLTVIYPRVMLYAQPGAAQTRLLATKWLLVPHIVFATLALVTGPFQFSERLRTRNLPRHRRVGKVYLLSIGLAASFALGWSFAYAPLTDPANIQVWFRPWSGS